jgi:hypothetical protein
MMARKAFGLLLGLALSVSWAGPLCAMSAGPTHACCVGSDAPMPSPGDKNLPACCRPADSVPAPAVAVLQAPAPAFLPSDVIAVAPPAVERLAPPRHVPSAPQAPPGKHSGLSPPSSGL